MRTLTRTLPVLAVAALTSSVAAQTPPVIDTIIVDINNVFTQEEAAGSWLYRSMNSLHIQTRPFTIRRELSFVAGDTYDPALIEESERKLRQLQM